MMAAAELPVPLTAFIGREQEVASVRSLLLHRDLRLLTLTGPPGVGKTRLATETAAGLGDSFADGVVFVSLAAVADPEQVVPAVARALGVQESSERSVDEALGADMKRRTLLLLLDNFEQVVAAGPRLAGLLETCPGLKVLVTSRAPLRLYGEHTFPVRPLEVPDVAAVASPEALSRSAAVRLFVSRAQAAMPDFSVTADNAPAIARLCHRLDGLPLALELAAPRIALFAPRDLLDHLTRSLSLRAGGPRGVPDRLRSLRDAIGWSYDLLSPDDRVLLGRLAVFAGGCTLEAADRVCARPADAQVDVLEGLASLVEQSLVRRMGDAGEATRFTMLETVREFALDRMAASGEEPALRRAHAGYYRRLAEQGDPGLRGPDQQRWRDRLESELDNLRAALAWSLESAPDASDAECGLRLAGALWYFWYWRGFLSEGRRWLSAALAKAPEEIPERARGLLGAGSLAWRQGDYGSSRLLLEKSVARWRELGDAHGLAEALHLLGHTYFDQQDYDAARATFEESRATYSAAGDSLVGLPLVSDLGMVAYHTGRYEEAAAIFTECLGLFREHGLKDRVADTLGRLGDLARLEGDLDRAARLYGESQELWRELHAVPGVASTFHKLGQVRREQGDDQQARALFVESLALQREAGNRQGIAECLAGLGGVAASAGNPETATRLLAATTALLERIGAPLAPVDVAALEADAGRARGQLDPRAWTAAWEAGRSMPLEAAIEAALGVDARPPSPTPGAPLPPAHREASPLSRREREVVALVAQGLSNREIARALSISEKTAANHVEHIITKLDVRSRTQAAVWAVEQGLARSSRPG